MGMPPQEISGSVHHRHHSRLQIGLLGGGDHELSYHLPAGTTECAEQLSVVEKIRPQHLRNRECPKRVSDIFEHLFGKQSTEHRPPLGGTRRAQPASLAGEGHQELSPAVVADNPCETSVVDPTVEKGEDGLLDGAAPEAVAALEALLPLALDLVVAALDELKEG
jgi:hypothetical protein